MLRLMSRPRNQADTVTTIELGLYLTNWDLNIVVF